MTDSRLADLERALEPLVEKGEVPGALVIDLDDLLFTSEKLCALLVEIAQEGSSWSPAELKSKLFEVQMMIEQDLPMIFDDLVPPLQKLSGEVLEEGPSVARSK